MYCTLHKPCTQRDLLVSSSLRLWHGVPSGKRPPLMSFFPDSHQTSHWWSPVKEISIIITFTAIFGLISDWVMACPLYIYSMMCQGEPNGRESTKMGRKRARSQIMRERERGMMSWRKPGFRKKNQLSG